MGGETVAMRMFEALIREATDRFGLGTQGAALLKELLALIGNDRTGGLTGFLDRFRKAGLIEMVASWVGRGSNVELTPMQLESVVGKDAIARIASKVGLAQAKAGSAMAFLLPKVVDALTPDGSVPATLPADLRGALGLAPAAAKKTDANRRSAFGNWWVWALLVAFTGFGWLFHARYDRPATTAAVSPATAPAATAVPAPVAALPVPAPPVASSAVPSVAPRLSLSNLGPAVEVSGVVGDEASRGSILDALGAVFGADRVRGDITVDAAAGPAGWLGRLRAALEHFKVPGADLLFDGNTISVGGFLGEADRVALLEKIRGIFGEGFSFALGGDKALDLFQTARERAVAALAALQPGYSASDLVGVLNNAIIRFATGSAEVAAESEDILDRAAAGIKAAPAGTIIEISGHTDATGDPVGNMALSQGRAEAVRKALIARGVDAASVVAQGYGDTRPLAANDTPQGRFQNRRIEFSVVK
jgi:outer membrane protein OmpA-like peptidoglycan-associated protein/uncharacterized protein YidB (DUF937 family)